MFQQGELSLNVVMALKTNADAWNVLWDYALRDETFARKSFRELIKREIFEINFRR